MEENNFENKNLVEKVDDISRVLQNPKLVKKVTKELRLPNRAKVKKGKLKKSWIGIIKIDENRNISFEKQQIEDSTFRTKDGVYHATDGNEILMWKGKFPIVMQSATKKNPFNAYIGDKINEVYGQKYIMARMLKDAIVMKNKGGMGMIIWIAIIAILGFGIKYLFFNK